jgi:6,7-dimethyl-8-ribityllumazine synthase
MKESAMARRRPARAPKQPPVLTGRRNGAGRRFGIVVSRFNAFLTERLLDGALEAFEQHDVPRARLVVARVPGSVELAAAARALVGRRRCAAVACLGAVLRGETPHFDAVVHAAARGIADVTAQTGVPVVFGIVTADTLEQAIHRCGGKAGNKGHDAAVTAIEMADLISRIG